MHLYRFWVANHGLVNRRRIEKTTLDYYSWADSWNKKVAKKKDGTIGMRDQIDIPDPIWYYADFLVKRGDRRRVSLSELNEADIPNARRQIVRYITKACKIAENVSRGEFTGDYEKSTKIED